MPAVTIIMAVKTGWEFLPEALTSIKSQTWPHWQLIIGINGHAVNSPIFDIPDVANNQDLRIRILHLHDCTCKADAEHAMVAQANSEWIALHDVDDLWHRKKLEIQIRQLDILQPDVLGTCGEWFGQVNGAIAVTPGQISFAMLLERNHLIQSSLLLRRDCCLWPITPDLDDYPLWLELAHQGKQIYILPDNLVKIRCHTGQYHATVAHDNSAAIRKHFRDKYGVPSS
jgi:teichuronic acid biosynthesis glycosyltransferase TuaG